jgi:hypothetical protein
MPGAEKSLSRANYIGQLQAAMTRGGVDAFYFVVPSDLTMRGAVPLSSTPAPGARTAIGIAGQWNLQADSSGNPGVATDRNSASSTRQQNEFRNTSLTTGAQAGQDFLTITDASAIAFQALTLATQPFAPPFLFGFSPTTVVPYWDVEATQTAPQDLLLASRLWIANGIRGIEYSPLQDTLTPAGWNAPGTSRYFRWDAPLDLNGNHGPRAVGVFRNGLLSSAWGAMLAATHLRADFGIVDLRTARAEDSDTGFAAAVARPLEELFAAAQSAGFAVEFVNPGAQPIERLTRDAVLVLPVPGENLNYPGISTTAQRSLVEFVRRGGTLIYFPTRPKGSLLEPLWASATAALPDAGGDQFKQWSYGQGHVISSSKQLFSTGDGAGAPAYSLGLASLLEHAGVIRGVERTGLAKSESDLIVTELIPNEPAASPNVTQSCAERQLCSAGLISVTNLGDEPRTGETLSVVDRETSVAGRTPVRIPIEISIPAHESLVLPVHAPLCSAGLAPGASAKDKCTDEVISSGSELLRVEREEKTLELTFFAPARAVIRLHLESAPSKVEIDPDIRLDAKWNQESGVLEVPLMRGAAPDFLRVMRVHLRYVPHVYEKDDSDTDRRGGFEVGVEDAVRLPLGRDAALPSFPPLILADPASGGQSTIVSRNHANGLASMDFTLTGAFHGGGYSRSIADEEEFTRIRLQPDPSLNGKDSLTDESEDGLLRGQLEVRAGHEHKTGPVFFVPLGGNGVAHYKYDFERDGEDEWVLESPQLRLVVSPENGSRAVALVDKFTNEDVITLDGAFEDRLIVDQAASAATTADGASSVQHPYSAEWITENGGVALRASYEQPNGTLPGLRVEKTIRMTAADTLDVAYKVLTSQGDAESSIGASPTFESVLGVPAGFSAEEDTEFCWQEQLAVADLPKSSSAAKKSNLHCEPFTPEGPEIRVPENVTRVETRTKNHPALAAEWSAGRAIIVPNAFSAQIRFVFPAATRPNEPVENTLRYTVISEP